jgi:hypothetical protein
LTIHDWLLFNEIHSFIHSFIHSMWMNSVFWLMITSAHQLNPLLAGKMSRWNRIGCATRFRHLTSPCDKDSDDFLMPVNGLFFSMLNETFKMFDSIEEERQKVFECLIFSDHCHSLQSSETTCPTSCVSTFQRARSLRDSGLMNNVGREGVQASHRRFVQ